MKTYPLFQAEDSCKKAGKEHRCFSVVESRRVTGEKLVQRTVLYLGEINDGQEAAWRKSMDVFGENRQDHATLSLLPGDQSPEFSDDLR